MNETKAPRFMLPLQNFIQKAIKHRKALHFYIRSRNIHQQIRLRAEIDEDTKRIIFCSWK